MSAAILCMVVPVYDIMSKAVFVSFALESNVLFLFLLFTRGKQTKHGSTLRSSNLKQANTAYAQTLI